MQMLWRKLLNCYFFSYFMFNMAEVHPNVRSSFHLPDDKYLQHGILYYLLDQHFSNKQQPYPSLQSSYECSNGNLDAQQICQQTLFSMLLFPDQHLDYVEYIFSHIFICRFYDMIIKKFLIEFPNYFFIFCSMSLSSIFIYYFKIIWLSFDWSR